MIGAVFEEEEVHQKVAETVKDYKHKEVKENMATRKFVYVRRTKDGVLMDIPEKLLDSHLKRRNDDRTPAFEFVGNIELDQTISIEDIPVVDELQCPLCGATFQNGEQLSDHKKTAHA